MNFFKDLKIGSKLAIGFGLLLFALFTIGFIGSWGIRVLYNNYTNLNNYPIRRQYYLNDIEYRLITMRQIAPTIYRYLGNTEQLTILERERDNLNITIAILIDRIRTSLNNDYWQMSHPDRESQLYLLEHFNTYFTQYINEIISPVLRYAHAGADNRIAVANLIQQGVQINYNLTNYFTTLNYSSRTHIDTVTSDIEIRANRYFLLILILSSVTLGLGLIISIFIYTSITHPLKKVVDTISKVEVGDFDVKIDINTNDEIGILSQHTANLIMTLKTLILEMNNMASAHDKGDLDIYINSKNYSGAYFEVTEKINYMVNEHIKTQNITVDVISKIANGQFDVAIERLPGQKAVLNDAIDNMCTRLKQVNAEIAGMIHAAKEGQLSKTVDETQFEGNWRDIMIGLNQVLESIKKPITEISKVMGRISKGNFYTKVIGESKGDFQTMSQSVNRTVDVLSEYITEISLHLGAIGSGNLGISIDREYVGRFAEIKDSINGISRTLRDIMMKVGDVTTEIHSGTVHIAKSSTSIAEGSVVQASSVMELTSAADTIFQVTQQSVYNSQNANIASNIAALNAQGCSDSMTILENAMLLINSVVESISESIQSIHEIATQTNMLALNAEVEAARAGENGKGFAVVAEEVGSLASVSQKVSKEATDLIKNLSTQVSTGLLATQATSDALRVSAYKSQEVSELLEQISTSSKEQSDAILAIGTGFEEISQVVQLNAGLSQESAAAVEELNAQTDMLKSLVSHFQF